MKIYKRKIRISKLASTCLFLGILFFNLLQISAQKEASKWVFGKNAGLDFSNGSPIALLNSKMETTEGCAIISDKNGKMQFYTDGISVWNRNNELMANGSDLYGDPSSTQSGVIVPLPASNSLFYLFSIDAEGGDHGFRYSIVDMSLRNGLGEVTEKNKLIKTPSTEKITAVKHRNNKDIWILTHAYGTNEFLAYLLTKDGLSLSPIISETGYKHAESIDNTIGYMKISPDGSQLAVAIKGKQCFQIFDFDNQSGAVSHPISFQLEDRSLPYGLEFSPNGSILYVGAGGRGKIYQVNLQAGSEEAIVQSMKVIGESKSNRWIGALQVAIDGKIYVSEYLSSALSVIENPNSLGLNSNFKSDVVDLNGNTCTLGLPTFLQSYFVKDEMSKENKNVQIFSDKANVVVNQRFILNNILFDFNKSTLRPSSFVELQKIVNILQKNPLYKIEISGHTDNVGNKSYNISLSKDRADAVANYLISKGINKNRISTVGEGSSFPIASNASEEGRQENRRVEFVMK